MSTFSFIIPLIPISYVLSPIFHTPQNTPSVICLPTYRLRPPRKVYIHPMTQRLYSAMMGLCHRGVIVDSVRMPGQIYYVIRETPNSRALVITDKGVKKTTSGCSHGLSSKGTNVLRRHVLLCSPPIAAY